MTAYERTGWRDQALSNRHRLWGFNCPAVDLDFLMVEYNLGLAAAVVEYKHEKAERPDLRHPTFRAINDLANRAGLPFLIARYSDVDWWFEVTPVNTLAHEIYEAGALMTEREFVTSLYAIRGRLIEVNVLRQLQQIKPLVRELIARVNR